MMCPTRKERILKGIILGMAVTCVTVGGAFLIILMVSAMRGEGIGHTSGSNSTYVTTEVDGKYFTQRRTSWNRMKVKEKIGYIPDYTIKHDKDLRDISLALSIIDGNYYNLRLPNDKRYTVRYLNRLVAEDGSIEISVYPADDNSINMHVGDLTSETKDFAYTAETSKAVHAIKMIKDDYVFIGFVYSNSEDWSTVLDAFRNISKVERADIKGSINELTALPKPNPNIQVSMYNEDRYDSSLVEFESGFLNYMYLDTSADYESIVKNYVLANTYGDQVYRYKTDSLIYMSNDEGFFSMAFNYNEQYLMLLYGYGFEAEANALDAYKREGE